MADPFERFRDFERALERERAIFDLATSDEAIDNLIATDIEASFYPTLLAESNARLPAVPDPVTEQEIIEYYRGLDEASVAQGTGAAELLARNNRGRADVLESLGALSSEEAAAVRTASEEALATIADVQESNRYRFAKWNDSIHRWLDSYHKGARDWVTEKWYTKRQHAEKMAKAQKEFQKVRDAEVARQEAEVERLKAQVIEHDSPAARDALASAEASLAKAEKEAKSGAETLAKLEELAEELTDTMRRTTQRYALKAADKALEAAGVDMAKAWETLGRTSDSFHIAGVHITEGYSRYLKKMSGSEAYEFDSALWKTARETTRGMSEREAARVEMEIARLSKLAAKGDEAEFIAQASRYMSPSVRVFLSIGDDFEAFRGMSWARSFMNLIDPRFYFSTIKEVVRGATSIGLRAAETVLGPEIVEGIVRVTLETGALAGTALEYMTGPYGMLALTSIWMLIDLVKHGWTWRLVDDFLGFFFISLKTFRPWLLIKEYPEFSKNVGNTDNDILKLMYYDWEQLAFDVDYWGKLYVDLSNKMDKKQKPAYRKMKQFKGIRRVPGQYIDPKNHPLDTDLELKECQSIENLLDNNALVGKDYRAPSVVNQYFPRKKGLVRNLAAFPMYKNSFDWADLDEGIPIQLTGNFSESELDPSLVELFKLWVDRGAWGPAYNQAKTKAAQKAAVAANKADYKQWIEMDPNWFMAAHEINAWIGTARGKRGITPSDMVMLAPKDFDAEWNTDMPLDSLDEFGAQFSWPDAKHQYASRYQTVKDAVGRYTYHPSDRAFLEQAAKGKIMDGEIVFPGGFPPSGCVEELEWTTPTGQTVIVCIKLRDAEPGEAKEYAEILAKGNEYRAELDRRGKETKRQWDQDVVREVWKSYRLAEKPFRTKWGYISKYKMYFLEELKYLVMSMMAHGRSKAWANYIKAMTGQHIPLNMNSQRRVAFMSMFASAAYSKDRKLEEKFERAISKKFGGLLENDVVTTSKLTKRDMGNWAFNVNTIIKSAVDVHWPVFFGDLQCRLFVLKNPTVVVLAFRGTSNLMEAAIDLDFAAADFITIDDSNPAEPKFVVEEKGSLIPWEQLLEGDDRFTVHRGFLRGYQALHDGIVKLLKGYYKKYPGVEGLFITGHSLGAAMSQLAAITLPRAPFRGETPALFQGSAAGPITKYLKPNCYAFASPLVGDHRFERFFDQHTNESAQVWNDGDIITMIPPFLIPAEDVTLAGYKNVIGVIESLAKEDKGMGGILFALHLGFEEMGLDSFDTLHQLAHDIKSFDKTKIFGRAMQLSMLANKHRPVRGGQVFLRLSDTHGDVSFEETSYDSGNSEIIFQLLSKAGAGKKDLAALHSIGTIVNNLSKLASASPDLFERDPSDFPSWAQDGNISPGKKKKRGGIIPSKMANAILDGEAKIVGYAHTKHHHQPWTVVPMSDVDKEEFVFGAQVDMQPVHDRHANSVKRRRMDRHDSSYRSSTYL